MRRLILALVLAAAGPALADPAPSEPRTAALARTLVEQAAAADLFEIAPDESSVVVRHTRSGLVCRMDPDATSRIIIFPQAARGEDVACDSVRNRRSVTLYATRFSFSTTLDEQAAGAEAAIHRRFPDARAVPSPATDTPEGSRAVEFLITHDGAPMYTRATVTLSRGWAIKLRYTAEAGDAAAIAAAQAEAAALWQATLADVGG